MTVLIAIALDDVKMAFNRRLLTALIGHCKVHVIFADGSIGRDVDVLMEFYVAHSDILSFSERLFYFVRTAFLLMNFNVDTLD